MGRCAPAGADDSDFSPAEFRKLRFQMIDDTPTPAFMSA